MPMWALTMILRGVSIPKSRQIIPSDDETPGTPHTVRNHCLPPAWAGNGHNFHINIKVLFPRFCVADQPKKLDFGYFVLIWFDLQDPRYRSPHSLQHDEYPHHVNEMST